MTNQGFTLVELLVVMGVSVLLMAILMVALGKAREQARCVQCASNLRELCLALTMYADENQDWIVQTANHRDPNSPENWHQNGVFMASLGLSPNRRGRSVVTCPSHREPGRNIAEFMAPDNEMEMWISYGMNIAFGSCRSDAQQRRKRMNFRQPALTMAFMDAYAYGNAVGEVGWPSCLIPCDAYRHGDYAQVAYLDQHVGRTLPVVHSCSEEGIDFAFWGCEWLKP
jgi:prepilin-type N-terminal cleavage/methylation domain-containing protein